MPVPKLHDGEVDIDEDLARDLLSGQFPDWADLPLELFPSSGTVNVIYRLGDDMYVRLPRVKSWAWHLEAEAKWLPLVRPHVPLEVPEILGRGEPGCGYPFTWGVCRWIEGEAYRRDLVRDEREAAADLAVFMTALTRVDLGAVPPSPNDPMQSLSLAARDPWVRHSIDRSREWVDAGALTSAWEAALALPAFDGPLVSMHGDIGSGNLLVRDGRLVAVLDWGSLHAGDIAKDVAAAWDLFSRDGRTAFRDALGVDDATWARACGWAITAVGGIHYYVDSNPGFARRAIACMDAVLEDLAV